MEKNEMGEKIIFQWFGIFSQNFYASPINFAFIRKTFFLSKLLQNFVFSQRFLWWKCYVVRGFARQCWSFLGERNTLARRLKPLVSKCKVFLSNTILLLEKLWNIIFPAIWFFPHRRVSLIHFNDFFKIQKYLLLQQNCLECVYFNYMLSYKQPLNNYADFSLICESFWLIRWKESVHKSRLFPNWTTLHCWQCKRKMCCLFIAFVLY